MDLLSEAEVWVLDETSFPKAGQHSVGVARQYCGALGKIANCQVAVSLHWSSAEASCPIWWGLYLPKEWLEEKERAREVKLPPGTVYRSKTQLALEAVDQALAWGLPPLPVVADSAYGNDFSFRQALRERHLPYAVQVEPTTAVWIEDPNLPVPAPKKKKKIGRPRRDPPAGGAGAAGESGEGGSAVAGLGLASRDLAPRQPGSPTFSLCHAAGLGGARVE